MEDAGNLTHESFRNLLHRIVDNHLPEESLVFEVEADEMVSALFKDTWQGHEEGHGDRHEFADLTSVKPILDITLVAFSTFKVISELRLLFKKSGKKIDPERLQEQWERRLRMDGVKPAKAKRIAAEFSHDLLALSESN